MCFYPHFCLFYHFQIQEFREKSEQLISIEEISETLGKIKELEQFKELLKAKESELQNTESEKVKLTEKLQESQEEVRIVINERDELKRVQEALEIERDQLKNKIKEISNKVSFPLLLLFV